VGAATTSHVTVESSTPRLLAMAADVVKDSIEDASATRIYVVLSAQRARLVLEAHSA